MAQSAQTAKMRQCVGKRQIGLHHTAAALQMRRLLGNESFKQAAIPNHGAVGLSGLPANVHPPGALFPQWPIRLGLTNPCAHPHPARGQSWGIAVHALRGTCTSRPKLAQHQLQLHRLRRSD